MDEPLETAHERNRRVYQELQQLHTAPNSLMGWLPDYADYYPRMITRLQAIYTQLLAASELLALLQEEGIIEVTIRSRTQTMAWPLDAEAGNAVGYALTEHLGDQLAGVEGKIIEAKGRLAGELTGGTAEEWHHDSARFLALLLEKVPMMSEQGNQAA